MRSDATRESSGACRFHEGVPDARAGELAAAARPWCGVGVREAPTALAFGIALGAAALVGASASCEKSETAASTSAAVSTPAAASSGSSTGASSSFATGTGAGGAPATFTCNPVTNQGCQAGETCDVDYQHLAFVCYGGQSTLDLCASCGPAKLYCHAGATCVGGTCLKFCCENVDCAAGATCDKTVLPKFGMGQVGLCKVYPGAGSGGSGGGGGSGGSGGSPTAPEPDCKAALDSPSKGSCVPSLSN